MHKGRYYSSWVMAAFRALKYYSYGLFGFALVCFLAAIFGTLPQMGAVLFLLGKWLWHLALLIFCLVAVVVVVESVR